MPKYFYTLAYIASTIFSYGLLVHLNENEAMPALFFLASLIMVLYFHTVNFKQIPALYKTCFQFKGYWLLLMFASFCVLFTAIYGPVYLHPSYYAFLMLGISVGCSYYSLYRKEKELFLKSNEVRYQRKKRRYAIACLLATILILGFTFINRYYFMSHWQGLILAYFGGISMFLYGKVVLLFKHKTQMKASGILAVRSWLMLVIASILLPVNAFDAVTFGILLTIIGVAFSYLVIPIYLFQKSIEHMGAERHFLLIGLIPILSFFVIDYHWGSADMYPMMVANLVLLMVILLQYLPIRKTSEPQS